MHNDQRPAPMFVGEHAALDFLNSTAQPRGTLFDWLETGADLLDWLVQSGLCREAEIAHLRSGAEQAVLDQVTQDVRAFRDAFRAFIQIASETSHVPLEHEMIAQISQMLNQGTQRLELVIEDPEKAQADTGLANVEPSGGAGLTASLHSRHTLNTAQDLLPRIAAACADLICKADFRYVRNCEGPPCSLFFLDVSKNHKRRWCTMEICGNRAKAAAYRKR